MTSTIASAMATFPFQDEDALRVPSSSSLECTEGNDAHDSPHVLFIDDKKIPVDAIKAIIPNSALGIFPTSLYLNGVLWTYKLHLFRMRGVYKFSIHSRGPHQRLSESSKAAGETYGSTRRNEPPRQVRPTILAASITFYGPNNDPKQSIDCVWTELGARYDATTKFSLQQLLALSDNGLLRARVSMVAPRSYFDLSTIIDLKPATVLDDKRRVVEEILRGGKPADADWAITVADDVNGGDRTFHVHKAEFARVSGDFAAMFGHGRCVLRAQAALLVVHGEQRCTMPGATAADMRVALHGIVHFLPRIEVVEMMPGATAADMRVFIPFVYGLPPPLHEDWQRILNFGQGVLSILTDEAITSFLAQWEAEICRQALALEPAISSTYPLLRLLTDIWICPYGWMPVAKRVVIGRLGDMAHRISDTVPDFWYNEESPKPANSEEERLQNGNNHLPVITETMIKHRAHVGNVRKVGIDLGRSAKPDDKINEVAPRVGKITKKARR